MGKRSKQSSPQRPNFPPAGVVQSAAPLQIENLPAWVSEELIQKTIEVWQPSYADPLTSDDAAAMIINAGRLFDTLIHSTAEDS